MEYLCYSKTFATLLWNLTKKLKIFIKISWESAFYNGFRLMPFFFWKKAYLNYFYLLLKKVLLLIIV